MTLELFSLVRPLFLQTASHGDLGFDKEAKDCWNRLFSIHCLHPLKQAVAQKTQSPAQYH